MKLSVFLLVCFLSMCGLFAKGSPHSGLHTLVSNGFYDIKSIGNLTSVGPQLTYGFLYSTYLERKTKMFSGFFYTQDEFLPLRDGVSGSSGPGRISLKILDVTCLGAYTIYSGKRSHVELQGGLMFPFIIEDKRFFNRQISFYNPLIERQDTLPPASTYAGIGFAFWMFEKCHLRLNLVNRLFLYRIIEGQRNRNPWVNCQLGLYYGINP